MSAAIAWHLYQGFTHGLTFAEYARQCEEVSVQRGNFFDIPLWEMVCDHPKFSSTMFFFKKDGLRLIGFYSRTTDTDSMGDGSLHVPLRVMPPGTWVEVKVSPIDYETILERQLPLSIPFIGDSSEPNSKRAGVWRLTNYRPLEGDLTPKIEFETIPLPDDGERVTSQGEGGFDTNCKVAKP